MTVTILDTQQLTSSSGDITASYTDITGMAQNLSVAGTSSLILFTASITINGGADNETDVALFIDDSLVCEGRCFVDSNDNELGMVQLAWWETGLSTGTHDFDVRARDGGQVGGIIYTGEIRLSQVIEFTGSDAPVILSEVSGLTSSQTGTASYVDITGMKVTPTITGGSTSLIVVSGTVSFTGSSDQSGFLGLEIESTIEAEGKVYGDAANESQSVGYMFAKKAMTAGTRDFTFQMKNGQGTTEIDTGMERHIQVVEFTNTPSLDEVIGNRTADTTATASFTRLNDMVVSKTSVASSTHFLVCSNQSFDSDSSDAHGVASIRIDGTDEAIGSSGSDGTTIEPGNVGLTVMKTGLSGSIDFETMFKEGTGSWTGLIIATDTDRHLQVIGFTGVTYKLEGTTRDEGGSTLATCRCILLKRDTAAEASRIYTIVDHVNSNGSGAYSFTGIGDNDARYMVVSFDIDTPIVRGVTDDFLQPVVE